MKKLTSDESANFLVCSFDNFIAVLKIWLYNQLHIIIVVKNWTDRINQTAQLSRHQRKLKLK